MSEEKKVVEGEEVKKPKKTTKKTTEEAEKAPKKPVSRKKKEEIYVDPYKNADDLANLICNHLVSKKGLDVLRIDISQKSSLADYFVIASAKSSTAVNALASTLEEKLSKEYKIEPYRREGIRDSKWAALDYGMVIVHIFHEETRNAYQLEVLWADEENTKRFED